MIHNVSATIGISCIVYAAFLINPPLAWLTAGVALLGVGIGGSRLSAARKLEASKLNDR